MAFFAYGNRNNVDVVRHRSSSRYRIALKQRITRNSNNTGSDSTRGALVKVAYAVLARKREGSSRAKGRRRVVLPRSIEGLIRPN